MCSYFGIIKNKFEISDILFYTQIGGRCRSIWTHQKSKTIHQKVSIFKNEFVLVGVAYAFIIQTSHILYFQFSHFQNFQ